MQYLQQVYNYKPNLLKYKFILKYISIRTENKESVKIFFFNDFPYLVPLIRPKDFAVAAIFVLG